MLARIRVSDDVYIEVNGDNEVSLFQSVARAQEVFSHARQCGKCGHGDVRFVSRAVSKKATYRELVCQKCHAKLVFGTTEDAEKIFPKIKWDNLSDKQKEERKDEQEYADKNFGYLPNGGFYNHKYKKDE